MKIGLIDVDGHNFPNLALMKLSAWHKAQGDEVEFANYLTYYDKVYMSKVFDFAYSEDADEPVLAKEIIKGGTGYDLQNKLPEEIEHMMPDYSLYGIEDTAFGYLTRGCPRGCPFCIVAEKEGRRSYKVAELSEFWTGQKNITLLDPNILGCKDHMEILEQLADSKAWIDINQGIDARLLTEENVEALNKLKMKDVHFAWDLMDQSEKVLQGLKLYAEKGKIQNFRRKMVYVLVNFNTSLEEDLYRLHTLEELGYEPYVMCYDKPNAPKIIKKLQRWVNNKWVFRSCKWEEYMKGSN